ncbi:Na/Pi cotransporter family protein [Roseibium sediminicola]|uniref:Na/Pi cotransporter family protein n=1 Tax=Roseibium sediminicola TaxID=2933272 RepID=A0ABT0GQS0_9HYPH|nr:Na/Pi cotransporter family protein [Roseibium sp. CAU 1639]MCK7611215.1 Na/Pi cotransporter family protein [Roseibium sp. CAU 1639]
MGIIVVIKMLGAVMLLLYAVRMVRTGFERAAGPTLRRVIGRASAGAVSGAFSGMVVAVLLQSATAVAMLAAGFATSGFITTAAGLAVLLGADLGSSLVVQFLVFDLSWLVPLLLAAGAWLFLKLDARAAKQTGRILLGIAFILLALGMIGEATSPLKDAGFMPQIAAYLGQDAPTAMAVGAVLAFLVHSSVAAVLMIAALVQNAGLSLEAAVPLVLGANVGAGLVALWLTRGMDRKARLLPLGNFLFRTTGAILALLLLARLTPLLEIIASNAAQQVVAAHVAFNFLLVVVCLPLTRPVSWLVERLLPEGATEENSDLLLPQSALDRQLVSNPRLALASATRELLRMGELVEMMARPVILMLEKGSEPEIRRLQQLDSHVNAIHSSIKLYIAEVNRGELDAEQAERSMELVSFAVNLERAGDLVAKNLLELALELQSNKISFSKEGLKELTWMHDRVLANMELALNVLVSADVASARELIAEKDKMRALERESHDRHLDRLKTRTLQSMESSNAHLEVVRSLKDINSLFASAAVPILAREGQLRDTRLVPAE